MLPEAVTVVLRMRVVRNRTGTSFQNALSTWAFLNVLDEFEVSGESISIGESSIWVALVDAFWKVSISIVARSLSASAAGVED